MIFLFIFALAFGVLAHLVERNTGSVEVSSSSLLYSTSKNSVPPGAEFFFLVMRRLYRAALKVSSISR